MRSSSSSISLQGCGELRVPLVPGAQGRSIPLVFGVCGLAESQGRAVLLAGHTEVVVSLALTVNTFLKRKEQDGSQ